MIIINITRISTKGIYFNIQRANNKAFTTSLYKIDYILRDKQAKEDKLDKINQEEVVIKVLLKEYQVYLKVFSKKVLDILPPYYLYNYKIKLEVENNLGYSLLYKIITKELKTIKQYLVKNLDKGFIKTSQTLYIALVLFIKKPNRSLQFYINFYKLN